MPTKKELLEEKTVKELKQMARDKDLSGYTGKRKPELVEMIEDNYLKDEIKEWPELGLDEIDTFEVSSTSDEEEGEEVVPVEEMEVDKIMGVRRDLVYVLTIIGSAIAGIVAVIALYFHFT